MPSKLLKRPESQFTNAHILFAERNEQYDYIKSIFTDGISNF